jgi:hypothetical protein
MADPRGLLKLTAGGREYRLWVGMSVLAELQEKHGQDVLQRLEAPPDAGAAWVPPLAVFVDLMLGALQRYHADEADRFLVDELLSENMGALPLLLQAAFPDAKPAAPGKPKPRRAG